MTDRDVIARALLPKVTSARVKWRTYDEEADAMIAALAAAGRVIVDQGAIAAAERRGMERAAVICDRGSGCIEARGCAIAIRADMETLAENAKGPSP